MQPIGVFVMLIFLALVVIAIVVPQIQKHRKEPENS
jgi:hypothetical protein